MVTDMDRQKWLFQLHLLEARKTGKVLILHPWEDPKSPQEVFREALRITSRVLEMTHPVYLHSFDAGCDTYVAWSSVFPNLLKGMSWLTAKGDTFEMLGRVMPFDHIALETESPHLCPLAKRNNLPQLIHHQAQVLASLRNLPLAVVFSGTIRNVEWLFRFRSNITCGAQVPWVSDTRVSCKFSIGNSRGAQSLGHWGAF